VADVRDLGTSQTVDLGGPTHYLDFGGPPDGPRMVCVHGLGGSALNWSAIGPRLAERCRVVALDLAGHGRSPGAGRSTGLRANRRLLDRFLREVAGTPVILVGNSMGGMLTILQAGRAPETVAGAVLVDPALPTRGVRFDRLVAGAFLMYAIPGIGERYLGVRRKRLGPERLVRETLNLCTVDRSRVPPEIVAASVEQARERAEFGADLDRWFLEAARSLMVLLANRRRCAGLLRAVPAPVLLLHGDKDRLVRLAAAQIAARANPTWRFEVAADTGHVPQLERPDWTAAVINDWLDKEGAGAADAARAAGREGSGAR
jgi:pimeloyl-ACP methyl ester carboxylesterase